MQSAYGASKACMESLARTWAVELGQQYGVTVNAVNPGPVATDMWK
jgi:3-oxoacyl-[acyl-carrier protein] reductase